MPGHRSRSTSPLFDRTVTVGRLPPHPAMNEEDIGNMLRSQNCYGIKTITRTANYAFAEFENGLAAQDAVIRCDGIILDGKPLYAYLLRRFPRNPPRAFKYYENEREEFFRQRRRSSRHRLLSDDDNIKKEAKFEYATFLGTNDLTSSSNLGCYVNPTCHSMTSVNAAVDQFMGCSENALGLVSPFDKRKLIEADLNVAINHKGTELLINHLEGMPTNQTINKHVDRKFKGDIDVRQSDVSERFISCGALKDRSNNRRRRSFRNSYERGKASNRFGRSRTRTIRRRRRPTAPESIGVPSRSKRFSSPFPSMRVDSRGMPSPPTCESSEKRYCSPSVVKDLVVDRHEMRTTDSKVHINLIYGQFIADRLNAMDCRQQAYAKLKIEEILFSSQYGSFNESTLFVDKPGRRPSSLDSRTVLMNSNTPPPSLPLHSSNKKLYPFQMLQSQHQQHDSFKPYASTMFSHQNNRSKCLDNVENVNDDLPSTIARPSAAQFFNFGFLPSNTSTFSEK